MSRPLFFFFLFILISPSNFLIAQHETLVPNEVTEKPVLDGNLDEAVWENALVADGFTSYWPVFGKPYPFDTKVYMVYTEEDMYFGFKCFDDDPDNIKSTMSARDQIRNEDWVAVILDPFNDQQSMFAFYANALGVQMDSKGLPGGNEDESADFVYYSSGQITGDGYVVEIRIPFKTLHCFAPLRGKREDMALSLRNL